MKTDGIGSSRAWIATVLLAACGASGHAVAACRLGRLAELPVTMVNMKPMVTASINGTDARFLVDSGAFYGLISPASAAEYKLKTHAAPTGLTVTGMGGEASMAVTVVKTFSLAGIPIPDIEFLVGGGESGGGGVGLIGQNVLRIADVEYDLGRGMIRLMREEDCGKANLAYWAAGSSTAISVMEIQSTTPLEPHTTGMATINGVKIRVMFDTGASVSSLTAHAAERAGISTSGDGVKFAGYSRGIGRTLVKTWLAPVASFKLGDEEVRNTHLRIAESGAGSADMLIGTDFFLSHHVYVASKSRRLFFTYNGGPVFNLSVLPATAVDAPAAASGDAGAPGAAGAAGVAGTPGAAGAAGTDNPVAGAGAADEPKDAAEYSRRGSALAARREFAKAILDLDRACELAPEQPDYFYERGIAHWENRQPAPALADLDQAIKLKPDHVPALVARAEMRIQGGDAAAGAQDLDAADRVASKEADARLRMATAYLRIEHFAEAKTQLRLWIGAHKADARMRDALAERCRVGGASGQDLGNALDDCNAVVRLADKKDLTSVRVFNSRALVRLRLGDYDKAIADYDVSLGLQPKNAFALYGRGLSESRRGKTAAGQSDMDAARQLQPQVADAFRRIGLLP